VRNNEIIPADSILFNGSGNIDYSFVTGESLPVKKVMGELIYAGGRQSGEAIELEVIKEVSQSYLTKLWNNEAFRKKDESDFAAISNTVSKYFTIVILFIAAAAALTWLPSDYGTALNVFTAVLIVACPCALALSTPFTLGNTLRIFGKNKFYLKNTASIEELAKINEIVFDKTGTLTKTNSSQINFSGKEINETEKKYVQSIVKNSTHPLSRKIYNYLKDNSSENISSGLSIEEYKDLSGKGIEGIINGIKIKLGTLEFVSDNQNFQINYSDDYGTRVYLSINNE